MHAWGVRACARACVCICVLDFSFFFSFLTKHLIFIIYHWFWFWTSCQLAMHHPTACNFERVRDADGTVRGGTEAHRLVDFRAERREIYSTSPPSFFFLSPERSFRLLSVETPLRNVSPILPRTNGIPNAKPLHVLLLPLYCKLA